MNYLDIYYRALIDYRRSTTSFRECDNQRVSVAKANADGDTLTVVRRICRVDTDWVDAIEEGLVHVEKAIREERQFIRSNGEVVDIEKVKNVSRDSVEHLSRHSNLITRYEEGEDIIPDRLYTVERLSDYAVYENRFLYMLLCYLRDFITVRYNKILELEHTYNGSMAMKKSIAMTKRSIEFEVKIQEEKKDDVYLRRQSESRDIIVKIGNQLKLVLAFLATPLMQEVAKSPMLKPPITKTNVLRMNNNFRGALKLYEFVSAYDKPGYEAEEKTSTQSPFRMDIADEMAEIVMLASFLTYEHGLNLKGELQEEYDLEEQRRKEEEKRRLLDQLKALRHRIRENGGDPEEYMLMLEKTNRLLQEDRESLRLARQEIEALKSSIEELEGEKSKLNEEIERLSGEIEANNEAHRNEIASLNESHAAEINTINEENRAEKERISKAYREEIGALKDTLSTERREHEEKVLAIEAENAIVIDGVRAMWQAEVRSLKGNLREKDTKITELEEECRSLEERRGVSEARLTAMRVEKGLITPTEDFASKDGFREIEEQLDIFIDFFKKQWGITKKTIREKAIKEYKESIKAEKEAKRARKEAKKKSAEPVKTDKEELEEIVERLRAEASVRTLDAVPMFEIPTGDEEAEDTCAVPDTEPYINDTEPDINDTEPDMNDTVPDMKDTEPDMKDPGAEDGAENTAKE